MRMIFFFAFLAIFSACRNDDDIPRGIIPKENMSKILWDVIQADQFSTQYLLKDSAKWHVKSETMKLYDEVFKIHHISKAEFEKSLQFYLGHPDITKTMFDSLSAQANRQRSQVYLTPTAPRMTKITPDSINRLNYPKSELLKNRTKIKPR